MGEQENIETHSSLMFLPLMKRLESIDKYYNNIRVSAGVK